MFIVLELNYTDLQSKYTCLLLSYYDNEYAAAAAMLAVIAMTGLMADTELPITS